MHDYQGKDPETGQPRYEHTTPYPVLSFYGTVKLHGTNAAVVKHADGTFTFQSRSRLLQENDNQGFKTAMLEKSFKLLFDDSLEFKEYYAVYGEWCGRGIQKSVAIAECDPMFVVFAVRCDGNYLDTPSCYSAELHNARIWSIREFPTFEMDIDFETPETSQNRLREITLQVEKECPVAKHFGVHGVGEGVVWSTFWRDRALRFKDKGDKHTATASRGALPLVTPELFQAKLDFVNAVTTKVRLNQGIEAMIEQEQPLSPATLGAYIRWIIHDIRTEEKESIAALKCPWKSINKLLVNRIREHWFSFIQKKK